MRLLVVEDEHSLREDIARKLRLSGYEVDACADGEAALEALAAERYDLVLLTSSAQGGRDAGVAQLTAARP